MKKEKKKKKKGKRTEKLILCGITVLCCVQACTCVSTCCMVDVRACVICVCVEKWKDESKEKRRM